MTDPPHPRGTTDLAAEVNRLKEELARARGHAAAASAAADRSAAAVEESRRTTAAHLDQGAMIKAAYHRAAADSAAAERRVLCLEESGARSDDECRWTRGSWGLLAGFREEMLSELRSRLQVKDEDLAEADLAVSQVRVSARALEQRCEDVEYSLGEADKREANLHEERGQLAERLKESEERCREHEATERRLKADAEVWRDRASHREQELAALEQKQLETQNELEEERIRSARVEAERRRDDADRDVREREQEEEAAVKVARAEAKADRLEKDLEREEALRRAIQDDLATERGDAAQSRRDIREQAEVLAAKDDALNDATEELRNAREETAATRRALAETEKLAAQDRTQLADTGRELRQLRVEAEATKQKEEEAVADIQVLRSRMDALREQADALARENSELRAEATDTRQDLESARIGEASAQGQVAELERINTAATERHVEREQELLDQLNDINNALREATGSSPRRGQQREQIERLASRSAAAEEQHEDYRASKRDKVIAEDRQAQAERERDQLRRAKDVECRRAEAAEALVQRMRGELAALAQLQKSPSVGRMASPATRRAPPRPSPSPCRSGEYDVVAAAEVLGKAMRGLGTDEAAVFATLKELPSNAVWCRLQGEFKRQHPDFNRGSLRDALTSELTRRELRQLQGDMKARGLDWDLEEGQADDKLPAQTPPASSPPRPPPEAHSPPRRSPGDIADALAKAMKGFGTDESGLYKALGEVRDEAEWEAVKREFKSRHSKVSGGDLPKAIKSELTKKELERARAILLEKGVNEWGPPPTPLPAAPAPAPAAPAPAPAAPPSGRRAEPSPTQAAQPHSPPRRSPGDIADALAKAMKGFGTDESGLYKALGEVRD
eukprot:Hpha_TRINITY_DN16053_c0_g2::TRINITY_DN16053_c0_g2_i1::g.121321::m.121321